jgi:phosphoribosylformimino-5-aminoimidazole carboxamide ribotide isomerase
LTFVTIPAIDIRGGRCVRLVQGDFSRETTYADDPVEMARHWQAQGASRLHVVDLDGAREGSRANADVIARLLKAVTIPVQVGGGIRGEGTAQALIDQGADRVIVGTAAAEQPAELQGWLRRLGPERVVIGIDARDGKVATRGWLETTHLEATTFARSLAQMGVVRVLHTDIARDGVLGGPNVQATRALIDSSGLHVIASGGVSSIDDLRALAEAGARRGGSDRRYRALRRPTASGGGGRVLTRRVIPCLDVDRGRVIRGVKFSADKVVGDPVELAAEYNRQGADELVFYDITASAEGRGLMMEVLHRAAGEVFIPLTVGGGVSTADDMKALLRAGADKVSVNTQAVLKPDLIAQGADRFGSQCIVLSMDVLWNAQDEFYEIVTHGGRKRTGMEALEWAQRGVELGAGELVVNSIDADGTREGYELRLTRMIAEAVSVPVVASGGAGKLEDLYRVLSEGRADAALAASIFHYGDFTVADAKRYLGERGVPVRLPATIPA